MNNNTLSSNLERIKSATDDIRTAVGLDETNTIEEVATAVEEVIPSGNININSNGTVDVSAYENAIVNVSGGGDQGIYKVEEIEDLEYLSAKENDLGVVTKEEFSPMTNSFSGGLVVPLERVEFEEPIGDYHTIRIMLEDGDVDISIYAEGASVRYMNWRTGTDYELNYTTEDSMIYVAESTPQNFEVEGVRRIDEFDALAAQLVTTKNTSFTGIYQLQNADVIENYTIINNEKCIVNKNGNFMGSNACMYIVINPEFGAGHELIDATKTIVVSPTHIEQLRFYFKDEAIHVINNYQNSYGIYGGDGLVGGGDEIKLGTIGTDTVLAENVEDIVFILEPDFVNWGNTYTIYADSDGDEIIANLNCEESLHTILMWKNYNIGTSASSDNIFLGKTAYTNNGMIEGNFERDNFEEKRVLRGSENPNTIYPVSELTNYEYTYLQFNTDLDSWNNPDLFLCPDKFQGYASIEQVENVNNQGQFLNQYFYVTTRSGNQLSFYRVKKQDFSVEFIKTVNASSTIYCALSDNYIFYTFHNNRTLYIYDINNSTTTTVSLSNLPVQSTSYYDFYITYRNIDNSLYIFFSASSSNSNVWKYDISNNTLVSTGIRANFSGDYVRQCVDGDSCFYGYNAMMDMTTFTTYQLGLPAQCKYLDYDIKNKRLFFSDSGSDNNKIYVCEYNKNTKKYYYTGCISTNTAIVSNYTNLIYDTLNNKMYNFSYSGVPTTNVKYCLDNINVYHIGRWGEIVVFLQDGEKANTIYPCDHSFAYYSDIIYNAGPTDGKRIDKIWKIVYNNGYVWTIVKDYTKLDPEGFYVEDVTYNDNGCSEFVLDSVKIIPLQNQLEYTGTVSQVSDLLEFDLEFELFDEDGKSMDTILSSQSWGIGQGTIIEDLTPEIDYTAVSKVVVTMSGWTVDPEDEPEEEISVPFNYKGDNPEFDIEDVLLYPESYYTNIFYTLSDVEKNARVQGLIDFHDDNDSVIGSGEFDAYCDLGSDFIGVDLPQDMDYGSVQEAYIIINNFEKDPEEE